ncbi:MAG TPA: hypothetical protein DCE43_24435 [Planctomycetaceae bacterium]|nr:hypothetical protein [Planctomycetaceae bacterium]
MTDYRKEVVERVDFEILSKSRTVSGNQEYSICLLKDSIAQVNSTILFILLIPWQHDHLSR